MEWTVIGAADGLSSGQQIRLLERQSESLLVGNISVRSFRRKRWALDAVVGAGVLQQWENVTQICPRCGLNTLTSESATRRGFAVSTGVDIPVRIAPHFTLAGVVRLTIAQHRLAHLGNVASDEADFVRVRARLAIGIAARAGW